MQTLQSLPGILTDSMIYQLCVPPINILQFKKEASTGFPANPQVDSVGTYLTKKEIGNLYRTGGRYKHGVYAGMHPVQEIEKKEFAPMISPFVGQQVRVDSSGRRIMSYGLSSMGYDVTLAPIFKIFTNIHNAVIDPLNMPHDSYVDVEARTDETGTYVILPPNSYLLGCTNETFNMPSDVLAICLGKSTGARAGTLINTTPIEPGFIGKVVIEIGNLTPSPMKIYANMGMAQFLFFRSAERCRTSYGDRGGKYQNQDGIQTAIV